VIEENKELEKMVSAGRVEQLGTEIALLKRENELCKMRIEGTSVVKWVANGENIKVFCFRWTKIWRRLLK
jgi:hypothetical protein